jgi:CBS domain-containing protein
MSLTAKDIMTAEVITVTPATPLKEFARICAEDGISGAPVVRIDGVLVGMVSKTDLVRRLLEDDSRFGAHESSSFELDDRQVDEFMQPEVFTVGPDTPVKKIADSMARERVHRIVITDGSTVLGIVTSLDVLGRYPAVQ